MANISEIEVNGTTHTLYDASAIHTAYTHPNPVTAGTMGSTAASSGNTIAVPYLKYNANGHVTESGTHTHTINSLDTSAFTTGVLPLARGGTGSAEGHLWWQQNQTNSKSVANQVWTKVDDMGWDGTPNGSYIFSGSVMFSNNSTGARGMLLSTTEDTATASFNNTVIAAQGKRIMAGNAACVVDTAILVNANADIFTLYAWQNSGSALNTVATSMKRIFFGNLQT